MTETYKPSDEILDKYADVLINCALNSGGGIKEGEVVLLQVPECAKSFYIALRRAILKSGGHVITNYLPDGVSREFYELASLKQLEFFPGTYLKGLIAEIDHSVGIIAETNKMELEGVKPDKIMIKNKAMKPYMDWRTEKENKGNFTWTLALYGTEAMAKESGMSLEEYWEEIIKSCYLDEKDPILKWKEILGEIEGLKDKLNNLEIDKLLVEGDGINLEVGLGHGRKWVGGTGRNIPSFEVFISPDWRRTEGQIRFNQPLYRYGNLIEGIELKFEKGKVISSKAEKGEDVLKEMISVEGADKIGEFSLTDSRLSRISKFMGETLYDENMGGEFGNCHIALGSSYRDTYPGELSKLSEKEWRNLGYNDSVIHTDIVSTEKKTVIAFCNNGEKIILYENGKFLI